MAAVMMQAKCETRKETAATNLASFLSDLSSRAYTLADRAENALNSVSRVIEQEPESDCPPPWMPPLLDEYRSSAFGIEASIRRIENALDRLEI